MPRTSTRQMRGLWGYNALQTGFHSFKVNDTLSGFIRVRRHSVAAKQHILVRLMQVKLHQLGLREMGMLEPGCMELSFAQGAGLSRDQRQSIAQAILPYRCRIWSSGGHPFLPAGGCFGPRHEQVVTLHKAQYLGRFPSLCPTSIARSSHACGRPDEEPLHARVDVVSVLNAGTNAL